LNPNIQSSGSNLVTTSGTSYWWYLNGTLIANANAASYTPSASGSYYARVSNGTCVRQTNSVDWLVLSGISGCTYPIATNYNPSAQVDDGSCFFNLNCECPADFDQNGVVAVADLLLFLEEYGDNCND
jgi:hypothetical protein